ncbi:MAG: hypothetical protein IT210_06750 [Armatimonadetes bacterium]|nr:hypothetical protein [Armatimonadota bacterium]
MDDSSRLTLKILYRADGNALLGTGHLRRGLRLRDKLRQLLPSETVFLTRGHLWARKFLEDAGARALIIPPEATPEAEGQAIEEAVASFAPHGVVFDVLDTHPELVGAVRAGIPIATFDDSGPGRLLAKAVVNVLVEELEPPFLAGQGIALYEGPAYATLSPEYEDIAESKRVPREKAGRVLVTLGGGDAEGLTIKAARALALYPAPLQVTFAVGSAFPHRKTLDEIAAQAGFAVLENLPTLRYAFEEHDAAVVAGGLTLYEAMATGTPAIALCQPVVHQRQMADRFQTMGAMLSLGYGGDRSEEEIVEAVSGLLENYPLRQSLSRHGKSLVDGQGTLRTAEALKRHFEKQMRLEQTLEESVI